MERSLKGGLLMGSKRQNNQLELALGEEVWSEAPNRLARGTEDPVARPAAEGSAAAPGFTGGLMEAIVARDNLKKALAQVKRNKGAPGVDGMTVEELTPYLKERRRSAPSCSTAPTGRSRCGGSRSRSPPGARVPSASQACPGEGVVSREFSEEFGRSLIVETSQTGAIVVGDEGVEIGIAFGMAEKA
ncbi:MAG TPA: hypothetical protein VHT52_02180, partial [Stellaceae bacterium]|nr:hypothetical protein [Stellaceae bacterium]